MCLSRLLAGVLLSTLLIACSPAPQFRSTDISAVEWGADFELTAHTGVRTRLSDYRGKLVILFFGYTRCPDICAPTLARLEEVMRRLGEAAGAVQVLFITVDPVHDTPSQLAAFVPRFNAAFIGLSGSANEIAAVAREYKVAYGTNPKATTGQTRIDHSGSLLVRDASGRMRLLIRSDASIEDIVHDLKVLLRRSA